MNLKNFDWTLLKADMRKVWSRPTFELAVGLVFFMSITSVQTLFKVTTVTGLDSAFNTIVTDFLVRIINTQMLPLVILSGILVSLSFARDYEQGLMQTLLSLPVSRTSIFTVKFVAIVLPLTLLSWGITLFIMVMNYFTAANGLLVLQVTFWALPVTLFAVMFYAGLASLIALALKKTITSTLTTVLAGFFVSFITTLTPEVLGPIADYLVFSPYAAPLWTLKRVLDIRNPEPGLEVNLPPWGFFLLIIFYAVVFLVPTYLYFTKRFEVRE
ncbi:MAG: ABC transporter permease subunit [Candidatus Bathyarchaeota archaeon]|jgi:ABC-type transport system involved in multi-copper enzyme maturation permease subunit